MRASDYLLLSRTKLQTRKVRSVLTVVSASILTTLLLTASFVYTGARQSIREASNPKLEGKHIAVVTAVKEFFSEISAEQIRSTEPILPNYKITTMKSVLQSGEPYGVKSVHSFDLISGQVWPSGTDNSCDIEEAWFASPQQDSATSSPICKNSAFSVMSDELFGYFADEPWSSADTNNTPVPVIISSDYALRLSDQRIAQNDSPKEQADKRAIARDKLIGSKLKVRYVEYIDVAPGEYVESDEIEDSQQVTPDAGATLKIVGIRPQQGVLHDITGTYLYGIDEAGIAVPKSYADDLLESVDADGSISARYPGNSYVFAEFTKREDLVNFVQTGCKQEECWLADEQTKPEINYYTDLDLALEETAADFWEVGRWLLGIAALGLALTIMSTTSKVILDSRKEIGVFRAIGAKRHQIAGIYAVYISLLMAGGLVLSVLAARVITASLDARFADGISARLAPIKQSGELYGHYTFFGFDIVHFVYLAVFIFCVGLAGSAIPVVRSLKKDPLRYLRED